MGADKILVLGGSGPVGIVLLRELLHRKRATIAYVRSSSKIPSELASNPMLEVIGGPMEDSVTLSAAIAKSYVTLSLLGPGPSCNSMPYLIYAAVSTPAADNPQDKFSLSAWLILLIARLLFPFAYVCMREIVKAFREEAHGLDWTVFRIAQVPGGHDEQSWKKGRKDATYVGYVGDADWKSWTNRSGIARWLVDMAEDAHDQWVGKSPAVSNLTVKKVMT